MTEIKTSHMSQTSINFNELNSLINLKFNFLQTDRIYGLNNKHDILEKKSLQKYTQEQQRKNFIKTKSENFFKEYNFGVPRYHEFNPIYSCVKVNNFLNEKIIDKEARSPKIKKNYKKEELFENIDFYFGDKNIIENKTNYFKNIKLSDRNNNIIDHKLNKFLDDDKQNNPKLQENNYEFNDSKHQLNHKNNYNKNQNKNLKIPNINLNSNKSLKYNNRNNYKNDVYVGTNKGNSNDKENKLKPNIYNSYKNYLNENFAIKEKASNNSFKNSKDFFCEISSMLQNTRNEINEYEDILEHKFSKRNVNAYKENSNDFSLDKKNKDEITNITYKNSNSSFSKDYNLTYIKKQNERDKNIAYEINRLKLGSDIPQMSKEFYLLNYNEALEKEKIKDNEKIIKDKHSSNKQIKISAQTNLKNLFKKTLHSDYLRFDKELKNQSLKNQSKMDTFDVRRNFNYNFDSEKFSTAVKINTVINFPTIVTDPKNFEEIMKRNTNNILERGKKLSSE